MSFRHVARPWIAGTALAIAAVSIPVLGLPAAAQSDGPTPGAYQRIVTAEEATGDLQAGTYTLKLDGSAGQLQTEYVGFPGSICPLTYTYAGDSSTLTLRIGGDTAPLCTRTTKLKVAERGDGLQIIWDSTKPKDRTATDKALFDMTYWTLVGSAPVASVAPSVAPAASPLLGSWTVSLTEDDFAGYLPSSADISALIATYTLEFGLSAGEQFGQLTFENARATGSCDFTSETSGARVKIAFGSLCPRTTTLDFTIDGDQLDFTWVSTEPGDTFTGFDQALFTSNPWTRAGTAPGASPTASVAPGASPAAAAALPPSGTYIVKLGKRDVTGKVPAALSKGWKPTTYTLVLDGDAGHIKGSKGDKARIDCDVRATASPTGLRLVMPDCHTQADLTWSQDGNQLTLSAAEVQTAGDAAVWEAILTAKPWAATP